MDLILLGLRGSGKSSLARSLSAKYGRSSVDLDDLTASLLGCATATDAWRVYGEMCFRRAEAFALRHCLGSFTIIALGGGTPVAPGAFAHLQSLKRASPPRLIYLRAPADILAARLRLDGLRPSITGRHPVSEVPLIFAVRDPLYLHLADAVVEVADLSHDQAVRAVAAYL